MEKLAVRKWGEQDTRISWDEYLFVRDRLLGPLPEYAFGEPRVPAGPLEDLIRRPSWCRSFKKTTGVGIYTVATHDLKPRPFCEFQAKLLEATRPLLGTDGARHFTQLRAMLGSDSTVGMADGIGHISGDENHRMILIQ